MRDNLSENYSSTSWAKNIFWGVGMKDSLSYIKDHQSSWKIIWGTLQIICSSLKIIWGDWEI